MSLVMQKIQKNKQTRSQGLMAHMRYLRLAKAIGDQKEEANGTDRKSIWQNGDILEQ